MIEKTNDAKIAVTNSEFKQRSWKIWLIAGIIVLAATGVGAYFMPTEQTIEQIGTPKEPETTQATQQTEAPKFSYGIVYEKRYNEEGSGVDIILLDSPSGTSQIIGNFKNLITSYALSSGNGQTPSNLTGKPYFYFINKEDPVTSTLLKTDTSGKILETVVLDENPGALSISKEEDVIAWCSFNENNVEELQYIRILDLTKTVRTEIPDPKTCSLGSHRITFSQDGKKVYYVRGFYELYGEFSDEEFKQLSKENENGLHVIDLATKQSSLIEPDYEENNNITFWNDSDVDLKAEFVAVLNREEDTITIKKLPSTTFDYLTEPQIAALATIDTVKIPGKYFMNYLLTDDGKGIFYNISADRNRSSAELGYYDLETKQHHTLEAQTQNSSSSISLFAATDKQHLYYLANSGNSSGTTLLYETNLAGAQKIIDSGNSMIVITSVVK